MSTSTPGPGPEVESARPPDPTAAELDQLFLLHSSALQAGDALARWWFALRADAQDVTTEESLDELLRNALQGIAYAMQADAVAVLMADEHNELVARAAIGMQRETWRDVRIPFGSGMAGRVAAQRKPLVVPDLSQIEVSSETLRDSGVRSLVAVPITGSGRVIGVLHADSYELAHFTDHEASLLTLVADRLGAAIEHVRLFEAERSARSRAEAAAERLGRLQRITAALSGDLDVDDVCAIVLSQLGSELGPESSSRTMWLVDGDRLRLVADWVTPHAVLFAEMALDEALPGPAALRNRLPLWIESRQELDAFPALRGSDATPGSVAVLPLVVGDEALGVMAVGYAEARRFDAEERNFLAVAAQQAAQALARARLRVARDRAAADSAFLADVSAALGASLDTGVTLRRAVQLVVPRLADMASVHVLDELGAPRRAAMAHRDPAVQLALNEGEEGDYERRSVRQTLRQAGGKPLLLPRPGGEMAAATALDEHHEEILRDLGARSAIAVPLASRGEELGLLGLLRVERSAPYSHDDLALAAEVGHRVAQALDNSLQHQRRIEVARALQASLLPPALVPVPGADVAAIFHPATAGVDVGGDFYDLFPLDEDRWVLMIGDVSGSGPAAAALTAQVRHGARVAARAGLEPAAVVAAVNATLDETTGSEWFCTMVYIELRPHADGIDMQVICAGHPPPLVLRNGHVEPVECQGPLLGVMPAATFPPARLRLGPGHAVVMVTDGATEARLRGSRGPASFFGEQRLMEVVAGARAGSALALVDAVSGAVLEFTEGQLGDDMAVVALVAAAGGRPAAQPPTGSA